MRNVMIFGATSAIAEATARRFAERGDNLYLFARNRERLAVIADDLKIRGAHSTAFDVWDAGDRKDCESMVTRAFADMEQVDIVLIAHGTLPDQKACERDVETALREININALSTIELLTLIANRMERQKQGTIAVITSVAGDRGRQSNYVYGAAKKMVSTFLQGLRNRLFKSGVNVLDIKPGFVDTPMTAAFKKGLLWAKPERVAGDIVRAIEGGKAEIYTPFFWRWIMLIIRNVPETVFKRLSL
ncbi:MAG: SDR family oxidoreductase [Gammaproteobacteria bacterium]|nr:SDR family oxidoreductase [Gammaproteobacteria bacterium]